LFDDETVSKLQVVASDCTKAIESKGADK